MTTAIAPPPTAQAQVETLKLFEMDHASWQLYELLLRDIGEQNIRITYDRGRLVCMSPLPKHEKETKRIGGMIEIIIEELRIPYEPLGSTTFKREDLQRGLEPDECYYLQHATDVIDKDVIDLQNDPPPDLVIEVDITHHPIDRIAIYAALGVPELWCFDGQNLEARALDNQRKYKAIEFSLAFPFLRPSDLTRFLSLRKIDETARRSMFRDWVRAQAWARNA
jgi:Uma2 family endonuclease